MALIRVINPNSNPAVTAGLAEATAPFAVPGRIEIACETLEEGPFGIESDEDTRIVVDPMLARMRERTADAFVIACYSDPGLERAREQIGAPVFGVQESAMAIALTRGARFGVIAVADASIPRHMKAIRAAGIETRLAGERALNLTVAETATDGVFDRLVETGRALIAEDGADVLILGCAGMARHRARLEATLGVPVIEPTQAAVTLAAGTLTIA